MQALALRGLTRLVVSSPNAVFALWPEAFKALSGMNVTYDIFPEDVYFDKMTAALSLKSDQYDAFMTGAYMTWTYGPAGWIEDLNAYINDPAKTNPAFAWRFLAGEPPLNPC
jgi:Bacterial extracellular solute-binding protein